MRVVLDTNVVVLGILSSGGAARALLELARHGRIELVSSPVLLEELEEVLGRFFPRAAAAEIRTAVEEIAQIVEPPDVPAVTRDPDDDQVLAAAVAAGAGSVVTRDKDLLTLGSYEGIQLLEPAPALAAIRAEGDYLLPRNQKETNQTLERLARRLEQIRQETGMSEEEVADLFDPQKPLPEWIRKATRDPWPPLRSEAAGSFRFPKATRASTATPLGIDQAKAADI